MIIHIEWLYHNTELEVLKDKSAVAFATDSLRRDALIQIQTTDLLQLTVYLSSMQSTHPYYFYIKILHPGRPIREYDPIGSDQYSIG